jgi:hypothetical protein
LIYQDVRPTALLQGANGFPAPANHTANNAGWAGDALLGLTLLRSYCLFQHLPDGNLGLGNTLSATFDCDLFSIWEISALL